MSISIEVLHIDHGERHEIKLRAGRSGESIAVCRRRMRLMRYQQQSNDFLKHLPTAAFVSIDEEMTGISIPSTNRPSKEATPEARWEHLKQAPERYSIIQLGVTLFHQALEEGEVVEWHARKYNFYMFPGSDETRDVVLNPGAVSEMLLVSSS